MKSGMDCRRNCEGSVAGYVASSRVEKFGAAIE